MHLPELSEMLRRVAHGFIILTVSLKLQEQRRGQSPHSPGAFKKLYRKSSWPFMPRPRSNGGVLSLFFNPLMRFIDFKEIRIQKVKKKKKKGIQALAGDQHFATDISTQDAGQLGQKRGDQVLRLNWGAVNTLLMLWAFSGLAREKNQVGEKKPLCRQ